jgi:hypothetical protein
MSQHEHRRLVSAESAILASGLQPLQKKYCLKCDVQYTWCKLRRSQLGYIELTLPVTHVWYLKGTTSLLGNLFGLKKKVILSIAYNSATTVFETSQKAIEKSITYLAEATSLSNLGSLQVSLFPKLSVTSHASVEETTGLYCPPEGSFLEINVAGCNRRLLQKPEGFKSAGQTPPPSKKKASCHVPFCPGDIREAIDLQSKIAATERERGRFPSGIVYQNNGPATNNNFYPFSFIHRWFDFFHFQSIFLFLSSPVGLEDKTLSRLSLWPSSKLSARFSSPPKATPSQLAYSPLTLAWSLSSPCRYCPRLLIARGQLRRSDNFTRREGSARYAQKGNFAPEVKSRTLIAAVPSVRGLPSQAGPPLSRENKPFGLALAS